MPSVQRIAPCLWFDRRAEEAATFYVSVFPNSRIVKATRYGKAGFDVHHMPAGTVMTVEFELDGQTFTALNGGPAFRFNEAVSLQVFCDTQGEIDHYWDKLSQEGDARAQQCGWLKDRYGLSWQIVPRRIGDYFANEGSAASERVFNALMPMKKIDLAALDRAVRGE
jgi:predicted 3-demethylubiquinone-9 3-methyltransferase (glyoxalase superfamily)